MRPTAGAPYPRRDIEIENEVAVIRGGERPESPRRGRFLPVAVALALVGALVLVFTSTRDEPEPVRAATGDAREPVLRTAGNPLLTEQITLAPVTCEFPAVGARPGRLRALYEAEIGCLERAWAPAMEQAGLPFGPVRVRLTDDPVTECGKLPPATEATGFYCGDDRTIYLPRRRVVDAFGLDPVPHVATLAHEYGHHIQELSGILDRAGHDVGDHAPGSPVEAELGRRVELQANCFAGLFLASAAGKGTVGAERARAAVDDFRNWVDSDTHGRGGTQLRWARTGFAGPTVSVCDTWSVPPARVK